MATIGGRHQSFMRDKGAKVVFAFLMRQPGVKRVTLGHTRKAKTKWPEGTCRVASAIVGGLRLLIHGSKGFTDTYVYTDGPPDGLRDAIAVRWPETVA